MSLFMSILTLFAGVGVFLAGMRFMSDGLQQSTGKGLKQIFSRFSNKRLVGYGIGTGVTALIQSSDATSVMSMGLVNAGIMQLPQATAIVLGAKLGTTITGVIVALSSFNMGGFSFNVFFAAMSAIGVGMIVFTKKDKINRIGKILMGFGFIFVGLIFMCDAMKTEQINGFFVSMFTTINNPLLLLLLSIVFTGIIQSSSAATGIYIALVGAGAMTTYQAFFLVMGANVGTCVTAIWAAIGATSDTKRVAFLHMGTAIFGATLWSIILFIFGNSVAAFMDSAIAIPEWRIAIFNVTFNFTYTLILLPFINQLVKLAKLVIKDDIKPAHTALKHIDERLLKTPSIAVAQVQNEVVHMASLAKENLAVAVNALVNNDLSEKEILDANERDINVLNKEIASYLIKISALDVSVSDEKLLGALHHVISDIERIGDHAQNFIEFAEQLITEDASFSTEGTAELQNMYEKVNEMFELSLDIIKTREKKSLKKVSVLEDEVDALKKIYGDHHIERLHKKTCSIEGGMYFYDVITELERIADHLINIAFSVDSPTGTQTAVID
ncbi:MAG: Na/Pi cotransporter family protein [Clostridia bacterium]|nr:Na/Pi cotransporter family protein [Clostridia bacterium]